MKLLEIFFNKKCQKERSIIDSFTAAGCVFTNQTHILGGYQPNKDIPYISGFGGSRLEGETFERTAVREMIEELFDIEVTGEMIEWIIKMITPSRTIKHTGYMILQYSFEQLDEIMKFLEPYGEDSGLYKVWPKGLLNPHPRLVPSVFYPLLRVSPLTNNSKKILKKCAPFEI